MRNPALIAAEFTAKCEQHEANYVEMRNTVETKLRKAHQIRVAISTYELKLAKATEELERELKVIEENYKV